MSRTSVQEAGESSAATAFRDAGAAVHVAPSIGDCFIDSFGADPSVLDWMRGAHQRARTRCIVMLGLAERAAPTDPHAPCGDLSEELWADSTEDVSAVLRAIRDLSGQGTGALLGSLWRRSDCRMMSDADFGAALHLASLAPAWTDPDFLACAVARTSGRESFPLWAAMDAAAVVPGSDAWLRGTHFHDERTLRRIARLEGHDGRPTHRTNDPANGRGLR